VLFAAATDAVVVQDAQLRIRDVDRIVGNASANFRQRRPLLAVRQLPVGVTTAVPARVGPVALFEAHDGDARLRKAERGDRARRSGADDRNVRVRQLGVSGRGHGSSICFRPASYHSCLNPSWRTSAATIEDSVHSLDKL
jgi:hypothetical protein